MGKPAKKFLEIDTNMGLAATLIDDLFAKPRREIRKWSKITGQTSQVRLAYPGQHLASIITGVKGSGTAARGMDLADGSEVKSCSRADQLGACRNRNCLSPVLPHEDICPNCGGEEIARKADSHWILTIKTAAELKQYLDGPRLLLILFDRPADDVATIQVRAWEIWSDDARHSYFNWFLQDYFTNNYQAKVDAGLSPAPCNLHPLKFDFFMMNPVQVFRARIANADSEKALAAVEYLADPALDRSKLDSELMPIESVRPAERRLLAEALGSEHLSRCTNNTLGSREIEKRKRSEKGLMEVAKALVFLDEEARSQLPRPSKRPKMTPSSYVRKRRS